MPPKGWKKRKDGSWYNQAEYKTNYDDYVAGCQPTTNWAQGGTVTNDPDGLLVETTGGHTMYMREPTKYDKYANWVVVLWTIFSFAFGMVLGRLLL